MYIPHYFDLKYYSAAGHKRTLKIIFKNPRSPSFFYALNMQQMNDCECPSLAIIAKVLESINPWQMCASRSGWEAASAELHYFILNNGYPPLASEILK